MGESKMATTNNQGLITGIIYTEMDDVLGPNPKACAPQDLREDIKMLVSIKTITLLTGEEEHLPKGLVIVPFPSLNSKGLVQYIKWTDETRRGGNARVAILILFKEFDDVIFYKYKADLKPLFETYAQTIVNLEKLHADVDKLNTALQEFHDKIIDLLDRLKQQELAPRADEAFPTAEIAKEDFDYRFKVIICGDPGVGKTSTVLRFTFNAFTRTYMPTIGTNISEKPIPISVNERDYLIQLIIWDVAGQTKFQTMRRHFYQGAEGILLVFDLTYQKTFDTIQGWYKDILSQLGPQAQLIGFLIGNKKDLEEERVITTEQGESIANELKFGYIESSALTGENVNEMFEMIAEALLKTKLFQM